MGKKFIFLLLVFASTICINVNAQLAGGVYTINSALPTSSTNYASFGEAIGAMSAGVAGAVIFNVTPGSGPYMEQISIGDIPGSSATNTVKFNGNGASVLYTILQANVGILMMKGTKYVSIDSLAFKSAGVNYGDGAILFKACNFDSITRCSFDLTALSTAFGTSVGLRITADSSTTSTTSSGATNCYFGNNKFSTSTGNGGYYYGILSFGPNNNNVFYANDISNFYYHGIYANYAVANKFLYNTISRATKTILGSNTCDGFYLTSNNNVQVVGNRIHSLGGVGFSNSNITFYGIYEALNVVSTAPSLIANNIVYNTPISCGIYSNSDKNLNIYHNTISADNAYPIWTGSSAFNGTYGIYIKSPAATLNVMNNNVSITGGGDATTNKVGIYCNTSFPSVLQRNNIYLNASGAQYYADYSGVLYSSLPAFNAANPTQQTGATSVDPIFTAAATGNLTPNNAVLYGNGVNLQATVTTDITGIPRTVTPTPGAFEYQTNGINNAGVAALVEPVGNYCPGTISVKATIYNAGSNTINPVTVNWSLNGTIQPPLTYSTPLVPFNSATGQSVVTVTLGSFALGANIPVALKVWTSAPNGQPDLINANDTVSAVLNALHLNAIGYRDTICVGKGAIINLNPSLGYSVGTLQWQSSLNSGSSWTDIPNTDRTSITPSNITSDTWFRVKMTSNSNTCYSDPATIYTTNPQIISHTPDTASCNVGFMTLKAVSSPNAQVKWYTNANAVSPVAVGPNYSPYVGITTSFWVSAGTPYEQPLPVNVVSGMVTSSGLEPMPFYYFAKSAKSQYIITADEMTAQGYIAGNINSLGLKLLAAMLLLYQTLLLLWAILLPL